MKASLILNDGEILRIEHGKYYVVGDDGCGMYTVSKDEFRLAFEKMRDVCENSWCEELKREYAEMEKVLDYVPEAVLVLSNNFVLTIMLSDEDDKIQYVYGYDNPIEVPIEYDLDGEPYFVTKEGVLYCINEFIRIDSFPIY